MHGVITRPYKLNSFQNGFHRGCFTLGGISPYEKKLVTLGPPWGLQLTDTRCHHVKVTVARLHKAEGHATSSLSILR